MATKLEAARIAGAAGIDTVILNGANPAAMYNVVDGTGFTGTRISL